MEGELCRWLLAGWSTNPEQRSRSVGGEIGGRLTMGTQIEEGL